MSDILGEESLEQFARRLDGVVFAGTGDSDQKTAILRRLCRSTKDDGAKQDVLRKFCERPGVAERLECSSAHLVQQVFNLRQRPPSSPKP